MKVKPTPNRITLDHAPGEKEKNWLAAGRKCGIIDPRLDPTGLVLYDNWDHLTEAGFRLLYGRHALIIEVERPAA